MQSPCPWRTLACTRAALAYIKCTGAVLTCIFVCIKCTCPTLVNNKCNRAALTFAKYTCTARYEHTSCITNLPRHHSLNALAQHAMNTQVLLKIYRGTYECCKIARELYRSFNKFKCFSYTVLGKQTLLLDCFTKFKIFQSLVILHQSPL